MKQVIKRNGTVTAYQSDKIKNAVSKAFVQVHQEYTDVLGNTILSSVEAELDGRDSASVEEIQNAVEKSLMKEGFYDVAKAYILYRQKRTEARDVRLQLSSLLKDEKLNDVLFDIQKDFGDYDLKRLALKFQSMDKEELSSSERMGVLIRSAEELTSKEEPRWEKIAGRLLAYQFHQDLRT
ncbi:MAG: ATP cone domain-containing protein, partial [Erysipelotrichaceae bacterium]|nr:ATP cone domain-containing protein [Erysipelotrichaceae bacterium]